MSPAELAARHPKLYHVTDPDAWSGIKRHGLLSTASLLDLFEADPTTRGIIGTRRVASVPITHAMHGRAVITDNSPLNEALLRACLDDGLTPREWLAMLNARVFFWPDEKSLSGFLGARLNRDRDSLVLVFDTSRLVAAHAARVELSPINSGAATRKPPRRGNATFTPLRAHSLAQWRGLRGGRDVVREVTVLGSVPDARDFLVCRRVIRGVWTARTDKAPR